MAKVIGHTPSWLSHPSAGARIFSDPEEQSPASPSKKFALSKSEDGKTKESTHTTTQRTIVHRGTEVFAVVGNKIRWADLSKVKEGWETHSHKASSAEKKCYKTFKTPVYYKITNLSVSPSGHFIAISTEHTVHIALLPDSSRLNDNDDSELKLKTYQLGPTTHVIPEAPLASVLWHPLAASSPSADCLITVTTEAAVRVWEFERTNHWSFERPVLAIDLRKLADGTSSDQDFEPSGFGKNRGFSADAFDMEASAACWGGKAMENEDPWAAMTLWTAMTNGDVYALCPLLPSKWRPTPTTIPALATSAVSRMASIPAEDVDPDERRAADQRYEWVQELDNEELASADSVDPSIRLRPSNPSAIPRLQGPFELPIDDMADDVEISDILVIPANLDEEDLFSGEDDYDILGGTKTLPFSIICLTTTENNLHVMIELDGVTGQWLPKKGRSHFSVPTWDVGEFVLLDTVSLQAEAQTMSRPTFTLDPSNPYHFFVTAGFAVLSLSLEDWASRVGFEVSEDDSNEVDTGLQTRLKLACQTPICVKKELISHQQHDKSSQALLSSAIFIEHLTTGSLLFTSSNGRVLAAQLDRTSLRSSRMLSNETAFSTSVHSPFRTSRSLIQVLQQDTREDVGSPPIRAPYAPSQTFYQNQMARLDQFKGAIPAHRRAMLTEKPLRLSPACLDVMTFAHRTFSHQTADVEKAAAELFRRCERLREELADQVRQMAELGERLNRLKPGNESDSEQPQGDAKSHSENMTERIEAAKLRQKDLFNRYERVRRKAGQVGNAKRDLSIKERAWIDEVDALAKHVGVSLEDSDQDQNQRDQLTSRIATAKSLTEQLIADAKHIRDSTGNEDDREHSSTPDGKLRSRVGAGSGGMSRFQRERIKEVMDLVEREAAVIEAVQGRLSKLSVNI